MNLWLTIGHNDLRRFLRERSSWVWLVVVPLVFAYFLGFAHRGPGQPGSPQPPVILENRDVGFVGRLFREMLSAQGIRVIGLAQREESSRTIRIPADFTDRVLRREPAKLVFLKEQGSHEQAAAMVEIRLIRTLILLHSLLVEQALQGGGSLPTEAELRELLVRPNPVRLDTRFAGRKPVPAGFGFSLPANLVMYLMMNLLIFGGAAVAWERRSGVLRRLMIQPMPSSALIMGKLYGLMLLGGVQIAVLLGLGHAVFKVNLGDQLPSILLTLVVYTWLAAALGLLAGSLIKSEEKVTGVCVLLSLVMGAVGGCWWPLEMAPAYARVAAHVVPTGWAMDALNQLISFGHGFEQARHAILVLVVWASAATAAAVKLLRVH
jgi:ABC-type multidrug transport system permease subunit